MWKGTVRNSITANAKKTLQVISQNEYSRNQSQYGGSCEQNSTRQTESIHTESPRGSNKRKGTSTSFGEKSSRKANLRSHRIIHVSFDRFDSLGSFVRSFLSLSHQRKRSRARTLLTSACVRSTTPKNTACERKKWGRGTRRG